MLRSKKMRAKVRTSETRQQSEERSSLISTKKRTTQMKQVQMLVWILQTASRLGMMNQRASLT